VYFSYFTFIKFKVIRELDSSWCHEQMSTEIFRHLIDKNNIENFTTQDQIMVKNLIKGENQFKNPLEV
jgi:hypothetical protein